MKIPFNKPYYPVAGLFSVPRAAIAGTLSGNGVFTKKCQQYFENRFHFRKTLLTTSCSDALEMAAILANIQPGDEVIMPSFTFVSTANAFAIRGAKLRFADVEHNIPDISPASIEELITPATRALVVVHYSGIACDMDRIMKIAAKHNLFVVEDAAHSIDSYYKGRALGSIGHFGTFSFHETKNIFCGEGGMLAINDNRFLSRAEIIWEKGTNRAAFYRGESSTYNWVDIGSSFLLSDALAAFLYIQLENLDKIQSARKRIWEHYYHELKPLEEKGVLELPVIPSYATQNGNMFYCILHTQVERDNLIVYLKDKGIQSVFHYLPLHSSPYFHEKHDGRPLPNTDRFSQCIIRLPFYYGLKKSQIKYIIGSIKEFFN
ncbi:MAG: dTDP-4-amino-4,6-dideoxygalactose transaminase [Bacteroidota bacterium]|nr:dTDP-4-amino-4,6-dideoxygalactose transaminase [Bacteroidota bacterium]